jgi:thiol-disulfide isomerase/thioredoxin
MTRPLSSVRWGRLVLIALFAGAAAGVVAVLATGEHNGNDEVAACLIEDSRTAALDPLARGEMAAFSVADTPRRIPDLVFKGPDQEPLSMADWEGRVALVNLWATWCAPCREEMPYLNTLQQTLGDDDFEVVAVNIDTRDAQKAIDFLDEINVGDLAFYRDETTGVFQTLKREGLAFGMPTTILVAEDGCLLGHLAGPAQWASAEALALIEAALPPDPERFQ